MTEAAFQECRKVMQSANYVRGLITKAKGEVAKWTKIEDVHRQELRPAQAEGAKKMLDKAMKKLEEVRKRFSDIKFPDNNLQQETSKVWIAGLDNDSFNYFPTFENKLQVIEAGLDYWETKQEAQKKCDLLNSM